jgi:hypothetical protein
VGIVVAINGKMETDQDGGGRRAYTTLGFRMFWIKDPGFKSLFSSLQRLVAESAAVRPNAKGLGTHL